LLRSRAVSLAAAIVLSASLATPVLAEPRGRPDRDSVVLWLTILHNNDAESKLIDAGGSQSLYGGAARFVTFQILPFSNFVTVLPAVPRAELEAVLENAYSRVESSDGRFAQVAGLRVTYDRAGTPGVGSAAATGSRVRDVVLDDGTVIVQDGSVIPGPGVTIATIDFLARGGDQYPFAAPFVNLAVSYQQALANYLVNGLSGQVTAAAYSPAGQGRIACVTSDAAQQCP